MKADSVFFLNFSELIRCSEEKKNDEKRSTFQNELDEFETTNFRRFDVNLLEVVEFVMLTY